MDPLDLLRCSSEVVQPDGRRGLALSRLLGSAVVLGSGFFKIPQIIRIFRSQSVEGLSPPTYMLELVSQGMNLVYYINQNHPFSTWGEFFFIGVQNIVILNLYPKYIYNGVKDKEKLKQMDKKLRRFFIIMNYTLSAIGIIFIHFLMKGVPLIKLLQRGIRFLPLMSSTIYVLSRLPQVFKNFKSKSTGELSALTWFLNAIGGFVRIYTTLKEVKDPFVLAGFISSTVLNSTVLAQILFYRFQNRLK